MTSATNETQIKKAKEQARKDRLNEKAVLTLVMSSVAGRRWVWLKLAEAQVFNEEQSLDGMYLAYRNGQRNAGLRLLAAITAHTPEMYLRMTQENSGVQLQEEEENGNGQPDTAD